MIPALVLTFDRNQHAASNMIHMYNKLGFSDIFHFYVPFQVYQDPSLAHLSNVSFVRSGASIFQTIELLCSLFSPQSLVYWCMDDKFPLISSNHYFQFCKTIPSLFSSNPSILSLLCTRPLILDTFNKSPLNSTIAMPSDFGRDFFLYRIDLSMIWLHQFIRVSELHRIFIRSGLASLGLRQMERRKYNIKIIPDTYLLFPISLLVQAESFRSGVPTLLYSHISSVKYQDHRLSSQSLSDTVVFGLSSFLYGNTYRVRILRILVNIKFLASALVRLPRNFLFYFSLK